MKQYTDSDRLRFAAENQLYFESSCDGEWQVWRYGLPFHPDTDDVFFDTYQEAIDNAMSREAERSANKALETMTGGNAG